MTAKQHASRAVRSFGIAIVVTVGVVAAILLAIALDDGGADLSYKRSTTMCRCKAMAI